MESSKQQEEIVTPVPTTEPVVEESKKGGAEKKDGKAERDAKKQARLAERQAKTTKDTEYKKDPKDTCAHKFGDLELNRSQSDPELRYAKKFTEIHDIDEKLVGQDIIVRGRLHGSRSAGKKLVFIVIRDRFSTVQATLFVAEPEISQGMAEYTRRITKESIIEVYAKVVVPENPIQGCSQKIDLHVTQIWTINKSAPMLPFSIDEAGRRCENQEDEERTNEPVLKTEESKEGAAKVAALVGQDVRLNNRIIDLRVPCNQALMRLQGGVSRLFREFLQDKDFTEIHSPKLIGGASEGGANIFRLDYFGQEACLAQSPQLYKQMVLCGDMQRVFEIGPVFRAEDSNTNRHLCEFTGLDIEMVFHEHYFEVLDLLADMFVFIFNGLEARYKKELSVVNDQYPYEDFKCKNVRLSFKEGVQLLAEHGFIQAPLEDLNTENEKQLGKLVREKYDTDFYMLYGYPTNARPFYTMLDPHDSNYTNSYDFFMRGEEITSGAQRIHDPEFLAERATVHNIPLNTIQEYIDAFKYGTPPHGGCGIGLERVVKLYCGIRNIRKCSLFPRDPKRLRP